MEVNQVKYALNTYKLENLLYVQLNNTKTLTVNKELRDTIKFNDSQEVIEFTEHSYGKKIKYVVPYNFIEGMMFNDPDDIKPTFEMEKDNSNTLKRDKDGKLVTNW